MQPLAASGVSGSSSRVAAPAATMEKNGISNIVEATANNSIQRAKLTLDFKILIEL